VLARLGDGAEEAGLAGDSQARSRDTRADLDRHMDAGSLCQGRTVRKCRFLETVVYPVV